MRTKRVFHAVDSHTEGMPTRVITGGVGVIPGDSMFERRRYFLEHLDHVRKLLMYEPRGHASMSGAILQPPTRPDADFGVLFIEVSGCLPMCGHGTMGVATVLVETGMVEVTEPVTTIRLETPAGLVVVDVAVEDGAAMSVTLRNVPSFCVATDRIATVPGFGEVRYDLAYGGNFYALVELDDLGLPFDRARKGDLLDAGLEIMAAINASAPPVHPENPEIAGVHHVYLAAPGSDARHSRHAMAIHPGWFDRSPCGTGTSRADGPAPRPRAPAAAPGLPQRLVHRHDVHRPAGRGDAGRRRAGGRADDHRPGVGHGHRPVHARPARPVPGGLRAVTAAGLPSLRGRRSLREEITELLRAAVMAGELEPGVTYSAPSLAEQFGVSATPVREAMLDLEKEGLVEIVRNKGFRVTSPSPEELDDVTELRALVEVPTIRALAERGVSAADLARLRPLTVEIEAAASRRDFVAHVALDLEFHLALLELAGNPRIVELVRSLRMHSRLYGLRDESHRDALFASWHEHAELLDRIEARDGPGAEAVMRSHIGHVRGLWAERPA